jgi:hypothetical protein
MSSDFSEKLIIQLISFCGAVILALLVFYLNKRKERKLKEKNLFDVLTFVKTSLKMNLRPIESQINSINKLLDQLKEEKVMDLHLQLSTSLDFSEWTKGVDMIEIKKSFFKHFNFSDRSKSWNEKNKTYYYNQLVILILHLRKVSSSYEEDFKQGLSEGNKFEKIFDEGKTILFEYLDVIKYTYVSAHNKEKQILEKEVMSAVDSHFAIKEDILRNDMYSTWEKLVLPMADIFKKNLNLYDIVKGVRICGYAFDSYKKSVQFTKSRFTYHKDSLVWSHKRISVLIRSIEKLELENEYNERCSGWF